MAEAHFNVQVEVDNTPKKARKKKNDNFSPIKLPTSPSTTKNLTGMKRLTKDLSADIFNHIQKWNDLHIKGSDLVRLIASIKTADPASKSEELETACCELSDVTAGLEKINAALAGYAIQIRTLVQLAKKTHPENREILFISRDISAIVNLIEPIIIAYKQEYNERRFVADNMPFTKTGKEATFLCILWTYQAFITKDIELQLEALLTEVGHRMIK